MNDSNNNQAMPSSVPGLAAVPYVDVKLEAMRAAEAKREQERTGRLEAGKKELDAIAERHKAEHAERERVEAQHVEHAAQVHAINDERKAVRAELDRRVMLTDADKAGVGAAIDAMYHARMAQLAVTAFGTVSGGEAYRFDEYERHHAVPRIKPMTAAERTERARLRMAADRALERGKQ